MQNPRQTVIKRCAYVAGQWRPVAKVTVENIITRYEVFGFGPPEEDCPVIDCGGMISLSESAWARRLADGTAREVTS